MRWPASGGRAVAVLCFGCAVAAVWHFAATDAGICELYNGVGRNLGEAVFEHARVDCGVFTYRGVAVPEGVVRRPNRVLRREADGPFARPGAVPRIVHFMDTDPPSKATAEAIAEWQRALPSSAGWTHVFWDDSDVDQLLAEWPRLTRCGWGIERLDYARYVLLWTFGGVYIDSDVRVGAEPLKPFRDGLVTLSRPGVSNSMMAAPRRHRLFEHVFEETAQRAWRSGVLDTCGPIMLNRVVARHYPPSAKRAADRECCDVISKRAALHISTNRWSSQVRRYEVLWWISLCTVALAVLELYRGRRR